LVDFGDGLAVWGSREEKIKAMRDEQVGVGGVSLGMVTLLVTALCMAELGAGCVLSALVVIEASAKLSMVTGAYAGRVACEGTGARFIRSMRKRGGVKFLVASATSLCIAALLGWVGLAIVVTSVLVSLIVVSVSNRHFGGVMGDGLGAMNDLSRMAALVVATGLL
jgi:adenosylcobinamide-GDP ribazoletransferase